ncbi:MAG: hypothetical protein QW757_03350, partial [Candidatus Woesearchaeota archaeon]
MKKKLVLLSLILVLTFMSVSAKNKFFLKEMFKDNDYTTNPVWELDLGGNVYVVNGVLHHDGINLDDSDRYWSLLSTNTLFSTKDYLELSFKGLLKSEGNPQEGRGIILALYSSDKKKRYDIRIQDGFTSGFPINQHSISLGYGDEDSLGDYIVTSFVPERDRFYNIKAVRKNNLWSLYVDGVLIGTQHDTLQIKEFSMLQMP